MSEKTKKVKKKITKIGYMDMTDFTYELGEAAGGNRVYNSMKEVLKNEPCSQTCGIVKVIVEYVETVKESKWNEDTKDDVIKENYSQSQQYYKHLQERKKHYEKLVKTYQDQIDNFSKSES